MARMNQKTKTTQLTTTVDVKSPSQDAIDAYKNKKQQEQESKALVISEESETNAMLAKAVEIAEKLSTHPEFNDAMRIAVQAKEDDDYKAIAALKWMELFLSDDDLRWLPWPGSTKADATVNRKPGSNEPLVYDKVKASGGRKGTESFYKTCVYSMPLGKEAYALLDSLNKENQEAKDKPTNARPQGNRMADRQRATRMINQQLSALRNAAKVRVLMENIKHDLPHIHVAWVRDASDNDIPIEENADLTRINVANAGEVVKSTQCLSVYSTKAKKTLVDSMKTAQEYTIGSFIKWNVAKAILIAATNKHTYVWVDDLIESGKKTPETGDKDKKTGTVSTARDVHNWTEQYANMNAMLNYLFSQPEFEQIRWLEFQSGIKATDDAKYTGYKLRAYLNQVFSDAVFEDAVKQLVVARDKK